jgi:hypothetical protein
MHLVDSNAISSTTRRCFDDERRAHVHCMDLPSHVCRRNPSNPDSSCQQLDMLTTLIKNRTF